MIDNNWKTDSWRRRKALQQPVYSDQQHLMEVIHRIEQYPPLVFPGEIDRLKLLLAKASSGKGFLLQGGDCAESFHDCSATTITNKMKILLQMSVVLCYGARKPVVRVGRIAGQYAKPRSADSETVSGETMPVYRGDIVNEYTPDPTRRQPDPDRLLRAYHCSSLTLNYIRAMIAGGFADLHQPDTWNLSFVSQSSQKTEYEKVVENIQDAISFMESLGGVHQDTLDRIEFYTSHEGLLLPYEQALTRASNDRYYNLGAHMLWIGDRTRHLDGAHVEYFRGISNPIGIKIGPGADTSEIVNTIRTLNPDNESGRITLITRFGCDCVDSELPPMIEAITRARHHVLWSCDPMHGNTIRTHGGRKTRDFSAIIAELRKTFDIHHKQDTYLGGIHFELTGENVTECIGGALGLTEKGLAENYETRCDPHLNYHQSLEMAFVISSILKNQ